MKPFYSSILMVPALVLMLSCRHTDQDHVEADRAPNFLIILVDDLGYSDLGCYGSEIKTPNLDQLANRGVMVSDFYVSSLCAPSRAMLLTGVDNHQNGLGTMPPAHAENQYLKPGYEGYLNNRVVTLPEVLRENGYHTYMAGK